MFDHQPTGPSQADSDNTIPRPTNANASSTMPATSKALPFSLTLILAATPSLGIGKGGTLPWPQLKKEMGYFARVTKYVPASAASLGARYNAVMMGRKTWDSIPERFRPLKGRLNIVITRKPQEFTAARKVDASNAEGPMVAGSVAAALDALQELQASSEHSTAHEVPSISRVFVIGGATIYAAALDLPQTDRVLLTKIQKEYECDTVFSVDLDTEGSGWTKAGVEELEEWTGENITEGGLEEAGVMFEFGMYTRVP